MDLLDALAEASLGNSGQKSNANLQKAKKKSERQIVGQSTLNFFLKKNEKAQPVSVDETGIKSVTGFKKFQKYCSANEPSNAD